MSNIKSNEKPLSITQQALSAIEALWQSKKIQGSYARIKASKAINWDKEKESVRRIISKDEKLAETVAANPSSLMGAMCDAASLGLSLHPQLAHCYLQSETIHYGSANAHKAVIAVPGYRGLEVLALRSKMVQHIQTELVYSKDVFRRGTNDNGTNFLVFEQARGSDRGALEGGFCRAILANGHLDVEWMTAAELEGCKAAASIRQKKTPATYTGAFSGEMYKKCIVRRASKHWDIGGEMVALFDHLDKVEPMDFNVQSKPAEEVIEGLSELHRREIIVTLVNKNIPTVDEAAAAVWIDKQLSAWGHKSGATYPDADWEKILFALTSRADKILAARKETNHDNANA